MNNDPGQPTKHPKQRSRRRLWITLAIIGCLVIIGSIVSALLRLAGPVAPQPGNTRPVVSVTPRPVYTQPAGTVTPQPVNTRVTNLNDNGPGSLRYAIEATPAGGIITFDPVLHGTILLTSGDLTIVNSLTIRGPGATILAISGGKSGHIVRVEGFQVTISGLTFKNSNTSDGFIFNQGGMLTLNNCIVSGNTGTGSSSTGGIFNLGGTLILNNSTVSGNTASFDGGGIFNNGGTLTLNNSHISGNRANAAGGGIENNGGTVTLNKSTVSGNTGQIGGGIYNNDGKISLNNSTVTGNKATSNGGGIYNNGGGTTLLNNSTVSGNLPNNIFPTP